MPCGADADEALRDCAAAAGGIASAATMAATVAARVMAVRERDAARREPSEEREGLLGVGISVGSGLDVKTPRGRRQRWRAARVATSLSVVRISDPRRARPPARRR
jgi:hypothetical protein